MTERAGSWHEIHRHPLNRGDVVGRPQIDITHHDECEHLPYGAQCWADAALWTATPHTPNGWPAVPGRYRMRPVIREDGENAWEEYEIDPLPAAVVPVCASCGRDVLLDRAGMAARHDLPVLDADPCPGIGRPPGDPARAPELASEIRAWTESLPPGTRLRTARGARLLVHLDTEWSFSLLAPGNLPVTLSVQDGEAVADLGLMVDTEPEGR